MIKSLKIFYSFFIWNKLLFIGLLIFIFASAIFHTVTPFFYKMFVDELPSMNFNALFLILIYYIGIGIGGMITSALSYLLNDIILINASADIRTKIFRHIQDLDFAFHTEKSTGSLISAFKRGDGGFFNLSFAIHFRILPVFIAFGVMGVSFIILNPIIALLSVISLIVSVTVTYFVIKINISTRRRFIKEEDSISGIIADNMINYETVKIFSNEKWEQSRLKKNFVSWKKALWEYGKSFRIFDISLGSIINLSVFITILISLMMAVDGNLTVGEFIFILGFTNVFYPRLHDLIWGFRDIAKNYADVEKYFGLLDEVVKVEDPKEPIVVKGVNGEIEFKNACFSYKGGQKNALNNLNLIVRQGQSIALVGRSGSGKTTVVKALMRFFDLEDGSIAIDGINIRDMTKSNLRSLMGIVPQEPILFNNTIGHNIGYGKSRASFREIQAAAKIAHIDNFIKKLPQKYKTNVGERGIKLSGGQKQRVAIARMILSDPDIVIFDEATSHLDSESESLIQKAFWRASKGKTTIIIAHRLSTIMRVDKVVVMERGRIVEIGSHKELLARKSLYNHLWQLQF